MINRDCLQDLYFFSGRILTECPFFLQLHNSVEDFSMHVSIYECESTGGSEWVLEQTVHLDDFARPSSTLDPRVSVDSNLFVYSRSEWNHLLFII